MEIIIPEEHALGAQVAQFIETLDDVQQFEFADRIETYEKFTHMELLQKHKLGRLTPGVYEFRVPISRANLRFFGKVCGQRLYLLQVFVKKRQRISQKEIKAAASKINKVTCEELDKLNS